MANHPIESKGAVRYVTIKRAAKFLGVSSITLRRWDKKKAFPAYRNPINGYRMYKLTDLEKLINEVEASK